MADEPNTSQHLQDKDGQIVTEWIKTTIVIDLMLRIIFLQLTLSRVLKDTYFKAVKNFVTKFKIRLHYD